MARCGRILDQPRYVEAAESAARFVLENLRRNDGRLLRSWREGRSGGPAFADDHALLAFGLMELSEATLDTRWLREARTIADELVRLFLDSDRGGLFQAGSDAEPLVVRPKEVFDNAVPSGNSAAADVLLRLGLLYGDAELELAGLSALRLVRDAMARAPSGFGRALCALDLYVGPSNEIALVGDRAGVRRLAEVAWSRFLPNTVLAAGEPGSDIPLLRDRALQDGKAAAYLCERFVCQRPVTEPEELATQLGE